MKILKDSGITAPKGFKAAGIHCGIKKKKKDLILLNNNLIFNCRVDTKSTLLCYNYMCSRL